MPRFGAIFIVICMVLIAGSVGAALYLLAGLHASEAMIVAVAVLTGLAIYNAVVSRSRDRSDVSGQITLLTRGIGDLARQVAALGHRVSALESPSDDGTSEKTDAVATEIAELGTLVTQLAETVAAHELKLASASSVASTRSEVPAPEPSNAVPAAALAADATADHVEMIEAVTEAIDAGRIDLYLQPIVTLPQRKVRYYEAFTRLRTAEGAALAPAEFLVAAEAGGLMPRIDKLLLSRSMQVVRRLQLKNREIGLFCNVSISTLNDPHVFPEILQLLDANRVLSSALILEMRQSTLHAMGPLEAESLAALRELGFGFCMDGVTNLRMEPRDLNGRGIRHVKIAASVLLDEAGSAESDIHAADLSDLLGRFGISLIAERIENETQVVDLLEYDVRLGQGYLFSQLRPVRADALRGAAEVDEPPAREAPDVTRKVAAGVSGAAF